MIVAKQLVAKILIDHHAPPDRRTPFLHSPVWKCVIVVEKHIIE